MKLKSITGRLLSLSLSFVLAWFGPITGLSRAYTGPVSAPPLTEEHEHRTDDHKSKSQAAARRSSPRETAPVPPAMCSVTVRPAPRGRCPEPSLPALPHSAGDLRNGIGAPLRC